MGQQTQLLYAICVLEWQQWDQGCRLTEDQGPQQEGPGGGVEDGPRLTPVLTTASLPTVPFEVHEFVHWVHSNKALAKIQVTVSALDP